MANLMNKFLYNKYIIHGAIFLLSNFVISQNVISDTKSVSAIALNPGFKSTEKDSASDKPKIEEVSFNLGVVKFTTTDKKLELNHYSYFQSEKFTDFFIGVSGSGEIKNSVTNIFSNGDIVSGGEANLRLGFRLLKNKTDWVTLLANKKTPQEIQNILDNNTKPASDLWLIATGGFTGSSFKIFKPTAAFSEQIEKINFTGTEINIGLNYWNARMLNNTILAGATIGIKTTNNFDDLSESSQEDTQLFIDNTTGTTRKVVTKQTVYTGSYLESTVYPLNFDLYFVPHKLENMAFLAYSRTDISKIEGPKTKLGGGIFFLKNQNAFNPVAGLIFDFADIFNVDSTDDSKKTLSKFKIGITTRINIVNNQSRK